MHGIGLGLGLGLGRTPGSPYMFDSQGGYLSDSAGSGGDPGLSLSQMSSPKHFPTNPLHAALKSHSLAHLPHAVSESGGGVLETHRPHGYNQNSPHHMSSHAVRPKLQLNRNPTRLKQQTVASTSKVVDEREPKYNSKPSGMKFSVPRIDSGNRYNR